ncbi:MAG TPA: hypothetical protein VM935_17315 [Chitinophagaceae bacterium]|jgi:hypothetical protein|nr:hypothetical protein [Chitinophagaceae bacterium]
MKPTLMPTAIILLFIGLISCNKEKLNNTISNTGPCYCYSIINLAIKLHRTNIYPAGSKIKVDMYSNTRIDTTRFTGSLLFNAVLPSVDTTLHQLGSTELKTYFAWKVTGPNNDSLSGGKTPVSSLPVTNTSSSLTFEINY